MCTNVAHKNRRNTHHCNYRTRAIFNAGSGTVFKQVKKQPREEENILLSSVPDENAQVDAASFEREADRNVDEHMSETDSTVPAFRP